MPECNHLDRTSAVIENGLHCAACGYNLHGLRHDGACPECGRRIEDAIVRSDLRFTSFRSIKRTRLGIALWAVSLALPPLGMIAFSAAIFVSPPFWGDRQSAFWQIYKAAIHAWVYAPSVAVLVSCLSIILIALPLQRRFERFKPRLGFVAAALALITGAYIGLSLYWRLSGLSAANVRTWHVVLSWIALGARGLAPCLAWIYLTARLHRECCRRLRTAMWATFLLLALIALAGVFQGIVAMINPSSRAPTGVIFSFEQPSWWMRLYDVTQLWSKYADPICRILVLAALWAYLRRLTTALPQPQRTAPLQRTSNPPLDSAL